jgi:predicted CopG family antitoxin
MPSQIIYLPDDIYMRLRREASEKKKISETIQKALLFYWEKGKK